MTPLRLQPADATGVVPTEGMCRAGCGACCIAPSISSPIPGMPHGKPAGVRCVQLDDDNACRIFGRPERPSVCASLRPGAAMCGQSRGEAMRILAAMEIATAPLFVGATSVAKPDAMHRHAGESIRD